MRQLKDAEQPRAGTGDYLEIEGEEFLDFRRGRGKELGQPLYDLLALRKSASLTWRQPWDVSPVGEPGRAAAAGGAHAAKEKMKRGQPGGKNTVAITINHERGIQTHGAGKEVCALAWLFLKA